MGAYNVGHDHPGSPAGVVRPLQPIDTMALREFDDVDGARWRVWDTYPARTAGLTAEYRSGWLTFDGGTERRRLALMPQGWEQ